MRKRRTPPLLYLLLLMTVAAFTPADTITTLSPEERRYERTLHNRTGETRNNSLLTHFNLWKTPQTNTFDRQKKNHVNTSETRLRLAEKISTPRQTIGERDESTKTPSTKDPDTMISLETQFKEATVKMKSTDNPFTEATSKTKSTEKPNTEAVSTTTSYSSTLITKAATSTTTPTEISFSEAAIVTRSIYVCISGYSKNCEKGKLFSYI